MTMRALWELDLEELLAPHRTFLRYTFVGFLCLVAALLVTQWGQPSTAASVAIMVVVVLSLLPSWLWVSGRMVGLPIVPLVALGDLVVFAYPLWINSEEISYYSGEEIVGACIAEAIFLAVLTGACLLMQALPDRRTHIRAISSNLIRNVEQQQTLFILLLSGACLFSVSLAAGWAWDYVFRYLPNGVFTAVRPASAMVGLLGIFFLAMAHGRGELSSARIAIYLSILLLYFGALGTSLLLSALGIQVIAWLGGYTLGRGRLPWALLLVLPFLLNILHVGKWEMRRAYWDQFGGDSRLVTPLDYPTFYLEWVSSGWRAVTAEEDAVLAPDTPNILDRASLVQMYLLAQRKAPAEVRFLRGETYTVIPKLLIPRVLWPDKPRTHLAQIILNVHFERQTLEDTLRTYIAWGMLAESWSNFGLFGPPVLGLFLGLFLGWMTVLGHRVPMGSMRFLVSAVVLLLSITATQQVMSIWVTSLFQALVAVIALCLLTMRVVPREDPCPSA